MATLNIPGLNVGLPVWLGTIPNVPNYLDASQLITLCHGNHVYVPSSTNYSLPPFSFSSESLSTSNWKYKQNRKRENRKKKSPTSMSHVGYRLKTSASHVEYHHPSSASHAGRKHLVDVSNVGRKNLVTTSHTRNRFVASI